MKKAEYNRLMKNASRRPASEAALMWTMVWGVVTFIGAYGLHLMGWQVFTLSFLGPWLSASAVISGLISYLHYRLARMAKAKAEHTFRSYASALKEQGL